MDRSEYKERMSRIDEALSEEKYEDALDYLDSINWKKQLNVNYLLEGAERYELLGKIYDAKELLEYAHERSPMGRMIIYRLALLNIRLSEFEAARNYYQKFIELAPNDNSKFVIRYQLSKAEGADDATLISILEELRSNELLEEWAFELAMLYRKTGQIDKCVACLDDIILWFGEGPFVEKAFEIKMVYRTLTKDQEIRYQRLKTMGSPVVEIHPGDRIASNEFLGRTIRIPEIEENIEKYSTQNLQAEIRKNIEEIMMASEMDSVNNGLDAIKGLIEDIPHLQIDTQDLSRDERKFDTKELDETVKSSFNEYLSEEFDGQLSLVEPGKEKSDDDIEGQLTIEEVMENWERTRRAAEKALLDAKEKELRLYKEMALQRAGDVLDKIIESQTALRPTEDLVVKEQRTFKIPRLDADGEAEEEDFEIPIISVSEDIKEPDNVTEPDETPVFEKMPEADEVPEIEEMPESDDISEAEEVSEADEISEAEEASESNEIPEIEEMSEVNEIPEPEEEPITKKQSAEEALRDINAILQSEIDKLQGEIKSEMTEEEPEEEPEEEIVVSVERPKEELGNTTTNLPFIDITGIDTDVQTQLSPRERENLSYFASIPGMETPLVRLISNVREEVLKGGMAKAGHIIIQARAGMGKTRLAQKIIKILQEETGKIKGSIGRIDAVKLNEKDIRVLFDKIRGGALIIENAGELSKDTMVALTLNVENDTLGTLLVLEDNRQGIDNVVKIDPRFARKFTERISIPDMTIDELVSFGKLYAAESGFGIDDMGVLALYDKINMIHTSDYATTINDVKEIVDGAISSQHNAKFKGLFGLFGSKGNDNSGRSVLQEKDFRED